MTGRARSALLGASADEVWPVLRDFAAWPAWHPGIASGRMEEASGDVVGAIRRLALHDGTVLREQLIARSDAAMSLTWCLVEASRRLAPYVVTLRVRRVTVGDLALVEWCAEVEHYARSGNAFEEQLLATVADDGLRGLEARFRAPSAEWHPPSAIRPGTRRAPAAAAYRDSPEVESAAAEPASPARGLPSRASGRGLNALAIVVRQPGGPDVLVPETVSVPEPGPGEMRVRHTAVGVNMIDVHGRSGAFGLGPFPAIPGMEGVGIVLDAGDDAAGLRPGDRIVYAGPPPGAYAAMRTMRAALVSPLPDDIDDRTAASVFLKGIMADVLLHDVHPVRAGEVLLVHAAAGGLGLILCGWARALGARPIGVVSSDAKVDAAAAAGCAAVIVSAREDPGTAVRDLTQGRGVDVVYDGAGAATFESSLAALGPRGHLVSFGQASGPVGSRDIDGLGARSLRLSRPSFSDYAGTLEALRPRAERLFAAIRAEAVRPRIDSEWPLRQAADAHRRLESRQNVGSVLLLP